MLSHLTKKRESSLKPICRQKIKETTKLFMNITAAEILMNIDF